MYTIAGKCVVPNVPLTGLLARSPKVGCLCFSFTLKVELFSTLVEGSCNCIVVVVFGKSGVTSVLID